MFFRQGTRLKLVGDRARLLEREFREQRERLAATSRSAAVVDPCFHRLLGVVVVEAVEGSVEAVGIQVALIHASS